jgi:hypothetical protein
MADIGQVLATGGTTIVGVAVGAGLTYWFSALNRRHQEAREDTTRWYEQRLRAYTEFYTVAFDGLVLAMQSVEEANFEEHKASARMLTAALSSIRLVGSPEVIQEANQVMNTTLAQLRNRGKPQEGVFWTTLNAFEAAARKDLGHPETETSLLAMKAENR